MMESCQEGSQTKDVSLISVSDTCIVNCWCPRYIYVDLLHVKGYLHSLIYLSFLKSYWSVCQIFRMHPYLRSPFSFPYILLVVCQGWKCVFLALSIYWGNCEVLNVENRCESYAEVPVYISDCDLLWPAEGGRGGGLSWFVHLFNFSQGNQGRTKVLAGPLASGPGSFPARDVRP